MDVQTLVRAALPMEDLVSALRLEGPSHEPMAAHLEQSLQAVHALIGRDHTSYARDLQVECPTCGAPTENHPETPHPAAPVPKEGPHGQTQR